MTSHRLRRWQSGLFCGLAWATALAGLFMTRGHSRLALGLVAVLVFVLGVPHGALDPVFARRLHAITSLRGWCVFSALYLLTAAAVVGLWWQFPMLFLCGFLALSAFHFSADPVKGASPWCRLAYGGAVIVLPALFHEREVAALFGDLVAGDFPGQLAGWLHRLASPWLAGAALCVVMGGRRDVATALELASVVLLMSAAPPLIAFAVFFCAMHSARHALRTLTFAGQARVGWLLGQVALPMAGMAVIAACCWPWLAHLPLESAAMRGVFVSLAALTVPHMALVERLRWPRAW